MFLALAILVSLPTMISGGTPLSMHENADYLKGIIKSGVGRYFEDPEDFHEVEVEYDPKLEENADTLGFFFVLRQKIQAKDINDSDITGKYIYDVRKSLTQYGGLEELQRWLKEEKDKLRVGCMEVEEEFEIVGTQFRCQFE